jgi:hypothetical protein
VRVTEKMSARQLVRLLTTTPGARGEAAGHVSRCPGALQALHGLRPRLSNRYGAEFPALKTGL